MTSKVRVLVGDQEISVSALCEAIGVNHSWLAKMALKIAEGPDTSMAAFYQAWLSGSLPVQSRPCESRELYRLYSLWCASSGIPPVSETKLLTGLPDGALKSRKHIRINGVMFSRTVVVPDSFEPPGGEPASEYLGRECVAFSEEVSAMERGQKS